MHEHMAGHCSKSPIRYRKRVGHIEGPKEMSHSTAGAFYFVELWLGFHIGFVGRLNTRKKLVMDGKAVAWYYLTRGQFIVDTLTAIAWIAQVSS